jgi:hypothetical protein
MKSPSGPMTCGPVSRLDLPQKLHLVIVPCAGPCGARTGSPHSGQTPPILARVSYPHLAHFDGLNRPCSLVALTASPIK